MIPETPEFVWKEVFPKDKFAELLNIITEDITTLDNISDLYVQHANFQSDDFRPQLLHIEDYKNLRRKLKMLLSISRVLAMNIDDYLAKINKIDTYENDDELVEGKKKCPTKK